MDIIKKKWREILIILGIIIVFCLLGLLINVLLIKKEDALFEQDIVKRNWNNIESGETSEEVLTNELAQLSFERSELEAYLPENLKMQDVNILLRDLTNSTRILDRDNCSITEVPYKESDQYKKFQIKVKNFYGTYNQVEDFMKLIENHEIKIVIEEMGFEVEPFTNNIKGENMVLSVYSAI